MKSPAPYRVEDEGIVVVAGSALGGKIGVLMARDAQRKSFKTRERK